MDALGPRFFRQQAGSLVARLTRRFGAQHLERVEDAVQQALLRAVEGWSRSGPPAEPSAWLYTVAHNQVVDELRRSQRRDALLGERAEPDAAGPTPQGALAGEVGDELLRLLFTCCDEGIPLESRLALALKTLCGFDVPEVAARLFTSEANVYKRLNRARDALRARGPEAPALVELAPRLPAVQAVLYLLFTEGALSSDSATAIRQELCDEAVRLGLVLAEHPTFATPSTCALLALMYLHRARLPARRGDDGGLLLLEEQDRTRWDAADVQRGLAWLARSAEGPEFSRYHAEAGVAAEHCLAPSFAQTRWERVVDCYALLERLAPSPLHTLNRALALAEWKGPAAGLAALDGLAPPTWLTGSYQWAAVLADLHRRAGHTEHAREHRRAALAGAPTPAIRLALERRLGDDDDA